MSEKYVISDIKMAYKIDFYPKNRAFKLFFGKRVKTS